MTPRQATTPIIRSAYAQGYSCGINYPSLSRPSRELLKEKLGNDSDVESWIEGHAKGMMDHGR